METIATAGLLSVSVAALGLLTTALLRLDGKMEAGFAALIARMDQLDTRLIEHLRNHG